MKMGKRKDKMANQGNKRRQILQLDDEQENRTATWQNINNNIVQRSQDAAHIEESTAADVPRVNPLSGLLSHYMDCEDEESDDENCKSPKQDKAIDVEVADFLKEIDALTAEETTTEKKTTSNEIENKWQECVDQTTGYTYYWNTVTNQVSWECPKNEDKITKINAKKNLPQKEPPKNKLNLLPGFPNDYLSDDDDEEKLNKSPPLPPHESKLNPNPNPKMGPHLPTVENNPNLSSSSTVNSAKDKPKDLPPPPLPDTTSEDFETTKCGRKSQSQAQTQTKIKDLFIGPAAPQIFPPSLEDDSDPEVPPIPCPPPPSKVVPYVGNLFPTQEGVSKHRGFGFSFGAVDGGKASDKISFVKAETLDLNALNRIAASEWKGNEKNMVLNDEDDDIDVIDRELDLALARKVEKERNSPVLKEKNGLKENSEDFVEDEVVRIANDVLSRLRNVDSVNKTQRLLVQTQTRLEDWRQGALTRSYFLTTLRQTEADVHRLVTQGDRIPAQNDPSIPIPTRKLTSSISTDSSSTPPSMSVSSEPPPLPPAREFLPPPPPPDSPPPADNTEMPMELEEPEAQSDMQMELNSFYSDIGLMTEPEAPPVEVPSANPPVVAVEEPVLTPPVVLVVPVAHAVKKEKKLKKARIATGLVLKKKNMPYLVEKWQKIKWEESQINSSDDESGEVSSKRSHVDES